jgi:hypothetical protein
MAGFLLLFSLSLCGGLPQSLPISAQKKRQRFVVFLGKEHRPKKREALLR